MYKIRRLSGRLAERKGQTMAEYALILGGIALVALAGFKGTGNSILSGALNTATALIAGNTTTASGGGAGAGGSGDANGGAGSGYDHYHDGD